MSRLQVIRQHMQPGDVQSFAPRSEGVEQGILFPVNSVGQNSGVGAAGAVEADRFAVEIECE